MNTIKLIIFDLDGTLVDAYPAIIKSFNYTMRKLSCCERPASVIRRSVGWGDEKLLKPFVKSKDLDKALSLYRNHHKKSLVSASRLSSGALRLLGCLKNRSYKLAVASNRPTRFSRILVRHLGLGKYFNYILCADKLRQGKPHPEILHQIMRKLSVKPAEVLYVGDMAIDARAGRRAKVKTIVVTGGSSTRKEIQKEKPYRIIRRITDLLNILAN